MANDQERAAFEAWARRARGFSDRYLAQQPDGYENEVVEASWVGWQAGRAALAAAPVTCQTYGPGVAVPCAECNQTLVDSQELAELREHPMNDQQERAAFEAWLNPGGHYGNVPKDGGRYTNQAHGLAWLAWKARAALAAAPVQAVPDGLCERICAAIKDADDKSVGEASYMLDSNDCIAIVREHFAAAPHSVMVDMTPPATSRDRWMFEQGRLAERDPRTHAMERAAPAAPQVPEPDALRKDAERYRWLREQCSHKGTEGSRIAANEYGMDWDAAIDAAMALHNAQAHSTEPAGRGSSAAPGCAEPAGKEN